MECCKTCKHWEDHEDPEYLQIDGQRWGSCWGLCSVLSKVRGAHNVETQEDFHCAHYEEREDG